MEDVLSPQAATLLIEQVEPIFRERYGSPRHHNLDDPLAELVFIIVSGRAPERRYLPTYRALRERYSHWDDLLSSPVEELTALFRYVGLERRKAADVRGVVEATRKRFGTASLDALLAMNDQNAERFLTSLPGVGLKSARCVMLYALERAVLPVDTHVWRVLKRLGIAKGGRVPSDREANRLQDLVPPALRYSLHVNLIAHGRAVCLETAPRCNGCPVLDLCRDGQARIQSRGKVAGSRTYSPS